MKTLEQIKEDLSIIAERYPYDKESTCQEIERFLIEQGYKEGGGEMARVERWDRGIESIYISYDPERSRIGISSVED